MQFPRRNVRISLSIFTPSRADTCARSGLSSRQSDTRAPTHRWHSPLCLFKSWDELNLLYSRRALPASLVAARSTGEKQTRHRSPLLARIHFRRYRMLLPARSPCSYEGTVWTSHRRIADVEWPRGTGASSGFRRCSPLPSVVLRHGNIRHLSAERVCDPSIFSPRMIVCVASLSSMGRRTPHPVEHSAV
ncbi:hypothetical protein B0H14DRAFT_2829096 [Mycena olivaceomarginata]|nr:hypothetical protein B0H14DRAFT_2829096 [Mycena olivaceomarginata]